MKTFRTASCAVAVAGAFVLLLQISSVAKDKHSNDRNRPVDITFTKWLLTSPAGAMDGFIDGDPTVPFVGHVFTSTASFNNHIRRLEAMYEVVDGDRTFSAMIRGGQTAEGFGLLDGVILDGWRVGAPIHVEFQTGNKADGACVDTPPSVSSCFEGTIHVGRVPTRDN